MKKYFVEITETLVRQIPIEAKNKDEALEKLEEIELMYYDQDIILDADDFLEVKFDLCNENQTKLRKE